MANGFVGQVVGAKMADDELGVAVIEVFHFEDGKPSFEDFGQVNGGVFWLASDLARCFGYETPEPFSKAINKAMAACATLGISITDNFKEVMRDEPDGRRIRDWKLSRFACLLSTMNGDVRKPEVAKAQAYFIAFAERYRDFLEDGENVERVVIRDEITHHEKSLSSTAKAAGITRSLDYAIFQNAGYRGMYNMDLARLKARKGVPSTRTPLDFMGREELAANLFRLTQTEAKIRNEGLRGQSTLERAAETVGRKVRNTMIETSGTCPEDLPPADDIQKVRTSLKGTQRVFEKKDRKAIRPKPEDPPAS